MTRRLLLAAASSDPVTIPDPLPGDGGGGDGGSWEPPPYYAGTVPAVPTAAPWHRSEPCVIPTYDGYDQTLHPSVVDFGGLWNGYRWWMMHTPYPVGTGLTDGAPDTHENPSLAASNDCVNWTPIGAQPLVPRPNEATNEYNSDVELAWDPLSERLEMWFRNGALALTHIHSADGTNWSSPALQVNNSVTQWVSQCIVRYSDTEWRKWDRFEDTEGLAILRRATASSPEGPWSVPVTCSSTGTPSTADIDVWHIGIARNPDTDVLYMLAHTYAGGGINAAISTDGGMTWRWDGNPVLSDQAGTWASSGMYRPYPVLHENGTHMRVWYSAKSDALGWRTGYAELPLTIWPA